MGLKRLDEALTVCKLASLEDFDLKEELYFLGKSPEELSLVCATAAGRRKRLRGRTAGGAFAFRACWTFPW